MRTKEMVDDGSGVKGAARRNKENIVNEMEDNWMRKNAAAADIDGEGVCD